MIYLVQVVYHSSKYRGKIDLILTENLPYRDYPPNKEAAFWLNNQFAPALEKNFKDIQIIITGPGEIPPKVHSRVIFTGYVADYFEHILASDICLVPYQMNTGISTKLEVFESCVHKSKSLLKKSNNFCINCALRLERKGDRSKCLKQPSSPAFP